MTAPVRPQDLAALPLFEHFTPDQLAWTVDHVDVTAYDAPTVLFREGDPTDALYVLLDGEIGLYRSVDGDPRRTGGSDVPGAWIGLPTIAPTQRLEARLERPSRLLVIPAATVEEMIAKGMPITPHLLKGLVKGLPQFEDVARQQERMAVLGKLAAGLAHELNNPAAAARRAAGQLRTALAGLAGAGVAIAGGDAALRERLQALTEEVAARAAAADLSDALDRGDREDAIAEWLEDAGVGEAWSLAGDLVEAGADVDWLAGLAAADGARVGDLVRWVAAASAADRLLAQVEESTARLSQLVGAMKEYSHLDRAAQADVDVRDGLESTLKILGHKLADVTLRRDYAPSLPRVTAWPSELNQVWTNLLDNAVDAVDGCGTITVRTRADGGAVVVEIEDDGPGMPPEVAARVFDPFYTTKPVGRGTGLGLDTVQRIVRKAHRGDVAVESRPGRTVFRVRLPVEQPRP